MEPWETNLAIGYLVDKCIRPQCLSQQISFTLDDAVEVNCHKDVRQKLRRIQLAIIPLTIVLLSQQPKKQFLVSTCQKADDDAIVKTRKRDSGRLPNAANLSKSLILSLFLYFFTCFVTEDIPSQHGSRQWFECPQYTGTNHMPVYEGTDQPNNRIPIINCTDMR